MTITLLLIAALHADDAEPQTQATPEPRPTTHEAWPIGMDCPARAPIKGNLTTHSGEDCIYHRPSGEFYRRTRPERCFETEELAREAGCRASRS